MSDPRRDYIEALREKYRLQPSDALPDLPFHVYTLVNYLDRLEDRIKQLEDSK